MGVTTEIGWTDATWNPWRGCDKVSPGCAHCYMFAGQRRFGRDPSVVVRTSPSTFLAPLIKREWQVAATKKAAIGRPHLVFTCSWSDWFHEAADAWRPEAWDIVRKTPQHTYQILTKRPERILEHLPEDWGDGWANVWLGVTVENRRFVERVDQLRAVPAAVRFISAEPLLGPLVPDEDHMLDSENVEWPLGEFPIDAHRPWKDNYKGAGLNLEGIDWLIVGGESGPGHRRIDPQWVRDLRDAAEQAGTAFFFKQWGGHMPMAGGRELDGRVWDEMPVARREVPA